MERWEDEAEIVRLARDGSLSAFDSLARRYRPGLISIATARMGREAAEDVVQETLIAAYKALPALKDCERFRPWLGQILRSISIRRASQEKKTEPLDELILSHAPSIVEDIALAQEARLVKAAIDRLPADQASVMKLFAIHGWTASEIAELEGLPLTTVKWRLHSARASLRQRFGHCIEDNNGE